MIGAITLGAILAALLLMWGLRDLGSVGRSRRRLLAAAAGVNDVKDLPLIEQYDRRFKATRAGRWIDGELRLAGYTTRPVVIAVGGLSASLVAIYLLWNLLAPAIGILGALTGVYVVRWYLRRGRERRKEAFIAQLPEMARVLANATYAGLSLSTALGIASDELDEPASSELKTVGNEVNFGTDLRVALDEMGERIGSREVAVLVSTLVVASRSGGSLVTSLREIAETLDERRETRREIKTTLAQSVATAYMVIGLGFGMLLLLNSIRPGTVDLMTRELVGQIALGAGGGLFTAGFLIIRRMTRIDL